MYGNNMSWTYYMSSAYNRYKWMGYNWMMSNNRNNRCYTCNSYWMMYSNYWRWMTYNGSMTAHTMSRNNWGN